MSVIEVIIALGMAAIVIAAIGNLTAATHRLTSSTGKEVEASAFAKPWIEILSKNSLDNSFFGCSCGATNPCPADTCMTGGQSCTARSSTGFNSCWLPNPLIGSCVSPNSYKLNWNGAAWTLVCADPSVTSDTDFYPATGFMRTLTITNLQRDSNGALVATGGTTNPDSKQATVTVSWLDSGTTRQVQLSTILTAWKNF